VDCVCCAESQTTGATPLCIASQNGHVECVRALLDGGAAINQAKVGCVSSMARHCRGLCGTLLRACMCSWLGAVGCDAVEGSGYEVVKPMSHTKGWGASRSSAAAHVSYRYCDGRHDGMMCTVLMLCGVADDWLDPAAHRQ
jgi:hypothetical protein